jgi:isopenicillin N synthase-like dioxygenase
MIESSNYLMNHSSSIPIINFSAAINEVGQQRIAQQIGQACQTFGFFYLTGFNLSAARIEQTFAAAKSFFALPLTVKCANSCGTVESRTGW